ncbi:hypothetical protein Unana1_02050 [Umbelopsis nana]
MPAQSEDATTQQNPLLNDPEYLEMRQTLPSMKSRLSQLDEALHALRNANAKIDALSAENAALKAKFQQFTVQKPHPAPLAGPIPLRPIDCSETRRLLRRLGVDMSRLIDVNIPTRKVISIAVRVQYAAELSDILKKAKVDTITDFYPHL